MHTLLELSWWVQISHKQPTTTSIEILDLSFFLFEFQICRKNTQITLTSKPRFAIILVCQRNFIPALNIRQKFYKFAYGLIWLAKMTVSSTGNLRNDCFSIFNVHSIYNYHHLDLIWLTDFFPIVGQFVFSDCPLNTLCLDFVKCLSIKSIDDRLFFDL